MAFLLCLWFNLDNVENKLLRSNLPKSLVCIYNNQVVAAGLGSMSQQLMDNLGGWLRLWLAWLGVNESGIDSHSMG